MSALLALGENPLTFEQYAGVADGGLEVHLADSARRRMQVHRESLLRQLASGAAIYGVNTGYGADSTRRLAPGTIRTVQRNTIFFSTVIFVPLLLLAAGTLVWWGRR